MLGVGLALILAFISATISVLVLPPQGTPAHVSAIVMLAGPGDRTTLALRLAAERRAPVLVFSQGLNRSGPCPPRPPQAKLICFEPNPADTRGEAEFVGRLATRYHWSSLVVVVSRPQADRARMLLQRCFRGAVYVATAPISANSWPYEITYGWGALIKALVLQRAC
jgi:hypothetical protein